VSPWNLGRRVGATVQLNRSSLPASSLLVLIKRAIDLLIAIGGNRNQALSFGRTIGCQSNTSVCIVGFLRLVVEKLRRLEVAILLRDVAKIIERKRAVWIERVSLEKVLLRGTPIVSIGRRHTTPGEHGGTRLVGVYLVHPSPAIPWRSWRHLTDWFSSPGVVHGDDNRLGGVRMQQPHARNTSMLPRSRPRIPWLRPDYSGEGVLRIQGKGLLQKNVGLVIAVFDKSPMASTFMRFTRMGTSFKPFNA
jgi:hypothetical protein